MANELQESRLAYAATGYVSADVAARLRAEGRSALPDYVDVQVEPGEDEVVMRVRREDVADVRLGPTTEGHTGVQLILNEGHEVETVTKLRRQHVGIHRFADPTIGRLTAQAVITRIFV